MFGPFRKKTSVIFSRYALPSNSLSSSIITHLILHRHQFFLVGSCLYFTSRALIRVSILLFYLRIFRTSRDKAIITWTLAVVVLFSFTLLFPIVFQCSPVDYLWLQWDGTRKGHCTNFRVFVWVATSIGIALDFWIVLIACSFVARLQLPLKKKIMVSSMFTVGIV